MRDTRLPLSGSLMYRQPIPDQLADVKLVIDDAGAASRMPPYRCINPRATLGAGDAFSIQVVGNGTRRLACSEFAEDAPDDRCLGLEPAQAPPRDASPACGATRRKIKYPLEYRQLGRERTRCAKRRETGKE
jgi:hypothetical protein